MDSKQKFYFGLGITLTILAVFVFGAIFPLIGKVQSASRAYLEGNKALLALEKEIREVKYLEKRYEEIKNIPLQLETFFLDEAEILGFITSLEKMAEETNNSLEIKEVSVAKENGIIKFQLLLSGSFSNLTHFLMGLENVPYPPYRLVEVENLNITGASSDNVQANLMIKAYVKKSPKSQ